MTDERDAGDVAGAIADGHDIDWEAALNGAPGEQRALLEQLRVLSSISRASGFPPGEESVRVTRHWGPFDIVEELDRGSYGRIYRARDTRVDRDVAVKLLPATDARDAVVLDEARALGKVRHPSVVSVYGADRFDGLPGLWTEFIEGQTLEQQLRERGRLGAREAILVGIDLCGALAAVHAAGLVHRDVNARNVMRERGGRIVLLDFGGVQLAREAESTPVRLTGTPLYMAPELFAGSPASPQSDIYAIGVLLFLLVTGQYPVRGETVAELRDSHRAGRRQFAIDLRPDLSPSLVQVIDKALAARPVDRYASAGEMRRALVRALDIGTPITGPGAMPARRLLPGWMMALLLMAAAAAGAAATALVLRQRASAQADDAVVEQLGDEQWSIVNSYHELADAAAARGDWAATAAAFAHASGVFSATYGDASSPAAIETARAAYARERAGGADLPAIERDYVTALYNIGERAGARQPIRAAIEGARAMNLWRQGKLVDAAHAVIRAIEIRDRTFRQPSSKQLPAMGFTLQALVEALQSHSPANDTDRDWVPDVIEAATGLDPSRVDTDGDGVPDDEEDTDGDGVANGLEWALSVDPTSVFGFDGTSDPQLLGARWIGGGDGARAGPTAERTWRISGPAVHAYAYQASEQKKRQAHARGWRLFLRGRARRGDAFAGIDLFPIGPVYVINTLVPDARSVAVRLLRRASATDATSFEFPAADADSLFELTRHSSESPVLFRVNGKRTATDYTGLTENQRLQLLTFGSANNMGAAPDGQADFMLVFVEVR